MKLSIIVPVYNCAEYIDKCIESLLMQKGAEIEIIIVNDGSTDNLLEILQKYEDKIKLISIENGGVAKARNAGMEFASGAFLMFVDADDALAPGCVEQVIKQQILTGADIVRFGYRLVFEDGTTVLPDNRFAEKELIVKKDFQHKIYQNYIKGIKLNSVCMTLFRKDMISGLRFRTDMRTVEDAFFSMHAYTRAQKFLILPETYYLYYQSNKGLTGNSLSVLEKYRCNFILSSEMLRLLPLWNMSSPIWHIRAAFRPVLLTFNKLKRLKNGRNHS